METAESGRMVGEGQTGRTLSWEGLVPCIRVKAQSVEEAIPFRVGLEIDGKGFRQNKLKPILTQQQGGSGSFQEISQTKRAIQPSPNCFFGSY